MTDRYFDDLDDLRELESAFRGDYWGVYGLFHQGASVWRRLWDELPKVCPEAVERLSMSREDFPDMPSPSFLEVEKRHAARKPSE